MNNSKNRNEDLGYLGYQAAALKVKNFLSLFNSAYKALTFYGVSHPTFQQSAKSFYNFLKSNLKPASKTFVINFYRGEVIFEETVFADESSNFSSFIMELEEKNIGSITFFKDLTLEEVIKFVEVAALSFEELSEKSAAQRLEENKVVNVKVTVVKPLSSTEEKKEGEEMSSVAFEAYRLALDSIEEFLFDVGKSRTPSVVKAKRAIQTMVDCVLKDRYALLGLVALKNFDRYTYHHSVNTSVLSLSIGSLLPLDRMSLSILGLSALLHDTGKVKLPKELITKNTPLSSSEWKLMEYHPVYGAEILSGIKGLSRLAMIVAFEHHLGYSLNGYPTVNKLKETHFFSRIVEIADVFDAATSDRPYKKPLTPAEVLQFIIESSGKNFDPLLVKIFIQLTGVYPVGSLVKLDTGEVGVVVEQNSNDLLRPKIKVFIGSDGARLPEQFETDLTVKDHKGNYLRTIVSSLPYESNDHALPM